MKLGTYKGLHGRKPDLTVQEQEIDQVLKNKQKEHSVVYNIDCRPAQMGDQAILNFDTECDGKPIPRGSSRNYPLLLGSHTFVKGFEEAIVGHAIGDRFDVHITFPSDYRIPDLAQKDVIYHIQLKALRIPEYQTLDDDFARDFSEFQTLAEWRNAIRGDLEKRREVSAYDKLSRELLDQIIASSQISMDPELREELAQELFEDFLYDLEDTGMTFEKYCRRTGKTKKQIRKEKEKEAGDMIRQQFVLHAIANKEHLQISEDELALEIAALAEEEGEDVNEFRQMLGDEEIEGILDQLIMDKAMAFVLDHTVLE